jgi:Putative beta-barrel porin 2
LTLAPVLQTNLGHDNNIFNGSESEGRQGDFMATFTPIVDAWLRLPRARAGGRAKADFYYYKELVDLRAVDWNTDGRLELPLNRLTPFVSGTLVSTTNSQNLEIDAIARQLSTRLSLGTSIRVTERISTEISARRSRLDYDQSSLYDELDLSRQLDYTSTGASLVVQYRVTPLTSVGVRTEVSRDRFDVSTERDSNNALITPFVEIRPLALISGRASVGIQSRKTLSGDAEDFRGTIVQSDLVYTLLSRTQFTVSASRSLQYSYIEGRTDYVDGRLALAVAHQLNDSWDVAGSFGRGRLHYRESIGADGSPVTYPVEAQYSSGAGIGYRLRRTRVGFRIDYYRRESESAGLGAYNRTRAFTSLTYTF